MENHLYTVIIDNFEFHLSSSTISRNKNFLLSNILFDNQKNDYVIVDNKTIYIDRDPQSFKYIVDVLRGYDFDINNVSDNYLKDKIRSDLEFYQLSNKKEDTINLLTFLKGGSIQDDGFPELDIFEKLDEESKNKMDTSVLKSNDVNAINDFIKTIDSELNGGNLFEIIDSLTNDDNVKQIMTDALKANDSGSDVESIEELKEEILENITSPIITKKTIKSNNEFTQTEITERNQTKSNRSVRSNYIDINL